MECQLDESLLNARFAMPGFRKGQREIISSVLSGRDVLAILPTGGGKSLCYQYMAVARQRLVLVISPLIALMQDQVENLRRLGVAAGCLHSGLTMDERRQVFRNIERGGEYVLYLSPERTQKEGFQTWLKQRKLALIAVDEAHCVSQWGHDFRAEYSQLKLLKDLRPDVPVLALTASATPFVLNDIARQLALRTPARHVHGFYRGNLFYQVEATQDEEEKFALIRAALKQFPQGRVLIYTGTRAATEEVSTRLADEFSGVQFYHAGLGGAQRQSIQSSYSKGETRILVATNAFGMGIDHPDVRLVIHHQMPANIDSLYQEMGRAGRDGEPSTCLLLYARRDRGLQTFFIQRSNAPAEVQSSKWRALDNLVAYAESSECRHAEILTYYQDAQRLQRCGHCDVCAPQSSRRVLRPTTVIRRVKDKAKAAKKLLTGEVLHLDGEQQRLSALLKLWRREKARELDVPAFVIMSDRTVEHLAKLRPRSTEDLLKVHGFGPVKVERFGQELLNGVLAQDL